MATVGALAALVGGEVVGDADLEVREVADLASAGPHQISFLSNPTYQHQLQSTRAGAVLVSKAYNPRPCTFVVCDDPYLAMARIARELHPPPVWPAGIEPGAHVHPEAQVDPTATVRLGAVVDAGASVGARALVGPTCYVGAGVRIGADVVLHAGARVLDGCIVDARSILQPGAVIGSDGFGYAPGADGKRHKIPQVGVVHVCEDVEIGANATIDRATFGVTRIGPGTKIDNLVQVAHNVVTGSDCVLVSQAGIAGSTTLGDRVIIGAQAGVVGHVEIASDVTLAARAGVPNHIKEAGVYSGTPILPHKQWLKVAMAQATVPELRRRVRKLEQRVTELEE